MARIYAGISVLNDSSVMLVDNWDDIKRRANIRPDAILAFDADWEYASGPVSHAAPDSYRIIIRTEVANYEVVAKYDAPSGDNNPGWFADMLDALDAVLMDREPRQRAAG